MSKTITIRRSVERPDLKMWLLDDDGTLILDLKTARRLA
jgi:hypothetical protein